MASTMMQGLADWLDNRTGYRGFVHEALEEPIPGGARWKYVFGSALTSAFMIQLATGLLLMTSYSPGSSTAWGSVFYIQDTMTLGWLIRGVHHFGAQAMVILLGLHLLQVVLAGAYRAPREMNWWFGLVLMALTLGFSLTGYLLPWDQKGYWATKVATNIAGGAPVIGPSLQRVVVGGNDYGNQTLTRFFGLHVGVLPLLLVIALVVHIALFRRHGVTAPKKAVGVGAFWPTQVFMDTVASALVLGLVMYFAFAEHGAPLDAPADPSSSDYPARPEWYFLSLFQMLKLFPGKLEYLGTFVIPTALGAVFLVIPLLDRIMPRGLAHFLSCAFVFGLFGGAGYLTYEAMSDDAKNEQYQAARLKSDVERKRALRLAGDSSVGIPPDGASYLLRRDPLTHGKAVLETKCLVCHRFKGEGSGKQVATDLEGFGSYTWLRGLLEKPTDDKYFGKVPGCDGMEEWKKGSKLTKSQLDQVASFVTMMDDPDPDLSVEEWLNVPRVANHPGSPLFVKECGQCHVVEGLSEGGMRDAPKLFGWGGETWMRRMIRKPGASDLYGFLEKKHQMPAFAEQLTETDLTALIRYLRDDYLDAPQRLPAPGGRPKPAVAANHE